MQHTVRQGECLSSIASLYGFASWETLWQHPANASLRERRKDPNVLLPGDVVFVPAKPLKPFPAKVGQEHRFTLTRKKARLLVRFTADREPLANEPFEAHLGSKIVTGTTDDEGRADLLVDPQLTEVRVRFPTRRSFLRLALGSLDVEDSISGAQARLFNLRFYTGPVDGRDGATFRLALKDFQTFAKLNADGVLDGATTAALVRHHGC